MPLQKVMQCLWFENQAEEAANFYVSIFKNAKITSVMCQGEVGPLKPAEVLFIEFELDGQLFSALNAKPAGIPFNDSISMIVHCDSQEEVDYYWDKLVEGGEPVQCGWLHDKFGISWQIVPAEFLDMLNSDDTARKDRYMTAMMNMVKLDISALKQACDG